MTTAESHTLEGAAEVVQAAEAARERLRRDPGDDVTAVALIDALERLVDHEEAHGTPDGALAAAKERVVVARDALARAPDDPSRLHRLVVCIRCVGDVLKERDDLESALAAHEEGVRLARRGVALEPEGTAAAWLLSVSLNRVGMVQESRDDSDDALFSAWSESLAIVRRLVEREPDRPEWLEALVVDLANVAWIYENRESAEEKALAQSMLEERAEVGRRLTEIEPDELEWLRDLVEVFDDLGDLHRYRLAWDQACVAHQKALQCGRRLVARQPSEPRWWVTLSVSASKLGHAESARQDLEAALAAFREGLACARAAQRDPSRARFCRYLEGVAEEFIARGELGRGLAIHEETLIERRALVERDPDEGEQRWELISHLATIADLRGRCGDETGELAAEDERERLRGREPDA